MHAAIYHGRKDLRVEDVDAPSLETGEVRIDVAACGICGSDLHEYEAGPIFPPADEPHPLSGLTLPLPLGHEFGGTVSEVGDGVTGVAVGDRVAVNPVMSCGECRYCQEGKHNLCPSFGCIGMTTRSGGFSEETVVPATNVHVLPPEIPLEYGALVEPLAVGAHAVRRSSLQFGDSVAVFGSGPIGLTVILAARNAGAKSIYVSEPRAARRELADEVGADVVLDPTGTDVVGDISGATDGGVDVAFEVAGVEASFNDAVRSTKRDGTITVVSISENRISTDLNDVTTTERTVRGTFCYESGPISPRGEFDTIIGALADGSIDPEPLVTGRIDLEDIVDEGFEALLDPEDDHVKILVTP